jgi:hypothetical protein
MAQRHPRWTLLASSFGLAMALVDVTVVNVAVSAIQTGLNTGVRGLSWVIDGYTLAFASLLLLAGGLGDRLGAKRIFVIGLALFTIASALCGAAPSLATLVLARILQGVGAALFVPSSLAILRQAYPKAQDRARAIGIWSALTAVAAASGPLVGGLLVASFGWQSIFLVNLPLGVVAVAMAIYFVRPSPRAVAGKGLDLFAQMTATASLALFTWALIERPLKRSGAVAVLPTIPWRVSSRRRPAAHCHHALVRCDERGDRTARGAVWNAGADPLRSRGPFRQCVVACRGAVACAVSAPRAGSRPHGRGSGTRRTLDERGHPRQRSGFALRDRRGRFERQSTGRHGPRRGDLRLLLPR